MTDAPIKVFFMGSGSVGIPAIEALYESPQIELLGVASQPDRPAGRKKRLTATPLAAWAEEKGYEVFKPERVSAPDFCDQVKAFNPDIIVVIAYGQLLRENMLTAAPFGCLNVHASILPKYRGASPIFSAVLNDEAESGISIMRMEKGMDTGPFYRIHKIAIATEDTSGTLEEKLAALAGDHLVQDVIDVVRNGLEPETQDHEASTHCAKIDKSFGLIEWDQPAKLISKKVYACQPWPGTWTYYRSGEVSKRLAITSALPVGQSQDGVEAGEIVSIENTLCVASASGELLEIHRVKPEGKREMPVKDFLLGAALETGMVFHAQPTQ